MSRLLVAWVSLSALWFCTGCDAESGPPRFELSGDITFKGEPLPGGEILFTPDSSQNNSGPQGVATIKDGKYDTAAADGKGIGGGPTVIRVMGMTAGNGKMLCEYEYRADLPKAVSTLKVEVPASAAYTKPASPEI